MSFIRNAYRYLHTRQKSTMTTLVITICLCCKYIFQVLLLQLYFGDLRLHFLEDLEWTNFVTEVCMAVAMAELKPRRLF